MRGATQKRLIVHMGVHKTGTTSMQAFLRRNKSNLSDQMQLMVPEAGSLCRKIGHVAWMYSLGRRTQDQVTETFENARDAILADPAPMCVISHENLSGAMPGTGELVDLFPCLPDLMDLMDKSFAPLHIEYVFYIRKMDRWKESVHNEVVKSNNYQHNLNHFLNAVGDVTGWDTLIAQVSTPDRKITFFNLEDETDRSRPGQQLLRYCGVTDAEIAKLDTIGKDRNESLTPGTLEFMRLVNGLDLPRPMRRNLAKIIIQKQHVFDELTTVLAASRKEH